MKKILAVASFLALVTVPAWAGGIGIMYSTWDTDDMSDDEGVGFKIEFDVGQYVDFEIRGAWLDELGTSTQGEVFQLEAMPVDVGLSTDFLHDRKVQPFVGGGLSYVFLNAKVAGDSVLRTDDEVGYYLVAGLRGSLTERVSLFGELLRRDLKTEITSDGFLNRDFENFSANLAGIGANVGLSLSW